MRRPRSRVLDDTNSRSVPVQIAIGSLAIGSLAIGMMFGLPLLLFAEPSGALMVGVVAAAATFLVTWYYQLRSRG